MEIGQIVKNRLLIIIIVIVVLIAVRHYVLNVYNNVGYTPDQPIKFSHKIHAGDNRIDCLYCHANAEKGPHAGIPTIEQCMGCHSVVAIDKPEIRKLTEIWNKGQAVEWVRVHRLPDHAYFSHQWHLNAGVQCETCHGDVKTMAVIGQVNRLEMGDCVACHRKTNYSDQYVQKVYPAADTSLAQNLKRYSYLKYINPLTLASGQGTGQKPSPSAGRSLIPATGVVPKQNASVQCNICHH